jgi:hypothetical protein
MVTLSYVLCADRPVWRVSRHTAALLIQDVLLARETPGDLVSARRSREVAGGGRLANHSLQPLLANAARRLQRSSEAAGATWPVNAQPPILGEARDVGEHAPRVDRQVLVLQEPSRDLGVGYPAR